MLSIEIQRLTADEANRLRLIRLRALRDAPEAFGSTLEESERRPASSWVQQVTELPTFVAVYDGADVGMVRGAADEQDQIHKFTEGWDSLKCLGNLPHHTLLEAPLKGCTKLFNRERDMVGKIKC